MGVAMRKTDPADLFRACLGDMSKLTPKEIDVLEICYRAASEGRPLEPVEVIMRKIGAISYSTVPGIMRKLENKGYIKREIYQRGRTVCIPATGQCSEPPANQAPHWRFRTDRVPSPAIHSTRQKMPETSALIEAEARRLGKHLTDFLADLVYIGWHQYQAEQEQGEAA